jgi:CheY-like chemotaxis protein
MDADAAIPRSRDILIADDDIELRTLLADVLRAEGYAVREAFNATEALMEIASHSPALLLLDIMMPEVSGIEVFDQLRAAGQSFPIVLITALPDQVAHLVEKYQVTCIPKPFPLNRILDCVAQYVQRGRTVQLVPAQALCCNSAFPCELEMSLRLCDWSEHAKFQVVYDRS